MTSFYLVSGFLGSGKTTFLKDILEKYSDKHRIAIIQNEFAPSGIDGKELTQSGLPYKLIEINNGSVFCVCLLGTFVNTLEKLLKDYSPEMVFLEASGLADPVNIIELLQKENLNNLLRLEHIFTIVDAPNFEKGLKTLPRFRHQIMIADTVILNKTDLFTGNKAELLTQIRELNPFTEIRETTFCKIELERYIYTGKRNHPAAEALKGIDSEGRPKINACVLKSHDRLTRDALISFTRELQKISPRMKGYVNMADGKIIAVQTVFGHIEMKEIHGYTGPTEIIAFGEDLTPVYLRNLLRLHEKTE